MHVFAPISTSSPSSTETDLRNFHAVRRREMPSRNRRCRRSLAPAEITRSPSTQRSATYARGCSRHAAPMIASAPITSRPLRSTVVRADRSRARRSTTCASDIHVRHRLRHVGSTAALGMHERTAAGAAVSSTASNVRERKTRRGHPQSSGFVIRRAAAIDELRSSTRIAAGARCERRFEEAFVGRKRQRRFASTSSDRRDPPDDEGSASPITRPPVRSAIAPSVPRSAFTASRRRLFRRCSGASRHRA